MGGKGDESLSGGTADDSSTGGDGNNIFVYTVGDGSDTITDFNAGNTGAPGDGDATMDNRPQRIRWISTTSLGSQELSADPHQRPVLIQCGVLCAVRDLLVRTQHGMMFGLDHLARATHLTKTSQSVRIAMANTSPVRASDVRRAPDYFRQGHSV